MNTIQITSTPCQIKELSVTDYVNFPQTRRMALAVLSVGIEDTQEANVLAHNAAVAFLSLYSEKERYFPDMNSCLDQLSLRQLAEIVRTYGELYEDDGEMGMSESIEGVS